VKRAYLICTNTVVEDEVKKVKKCRTIKAGILSLFI